MNENCENCDGIIMSFFLLSINHIIIIFILIFLILI